MLVKCILHCVKGRSPMVFTSLVPSSYWDEKASYQSLGAPRHAITSSLITIRWFGLPNTSITYIIAECFWMRQLLQELQTQFLRSLSNVTMLVLYIWQPTPSTTVTWNISRSTFTSPGEKVTLGNVSHVQGYLDQRLAWYSDLMTLGLFIASGSFPCDCMWLLEMYNNSICDCCNIVTQATSNYIYERT